ncbi:MULTISPECIES: DUF4232 domain-containing protein [unclassified Streptomyces]|jgi:hypothetical protein|uniref:DUF4232 domain-containing protein n=1 Tax=unclassified Streptomyces TaxID=2593676 RepID=UPI00081B7647|nr:MULTISPECIES: DUF4232 domain-containing protein [unclassified Streptomyces]MEE1747772.1 DUF4232 domain-containing protein [Streptomyces sp. JV184]MYQ83586.1 DUF4232 domain-containing protein [Streptomyces sp. SID4936]SCD69662.1 Protein of unknown function [Streptomyces sp. DvalAA-43]
MRTIRTRKHTAALGAVTAVLALALTACGGGDETGTKSAGSADNAASAGASTDAGQSSDATKATGTSKADSTAQNTGATKTGTSKTSTSKGGSTASGNTSDSYAYKHPCKSSDLSVRVYPREGSATQQVIEVNNTGANSCGLSYFPRVSLGASKASDHSGDITPAVPGGLGGAPAYPVKPKTAAIAVIDLNPSGGNGLTWINEMNVLADGDHMPNADTQNFELGPDVKVRDPKLGLYRGTVADAVSSMKSAGKS